MHSERKFALFKFAPSLSLVILLGHYYCSPHQFWIYCNANGLIYWTSAELLYMGKILQYHLYYCYLRVSWKMVNLKVIKILFLMDIAQCFCFIHTRNSFYYLKTNIRHSFSRFRNVTFKHPETYGMADLNCFSIEIECKTGKCSETWFLTIW